MDQLFNELDKQTLSHQDWKPIIVKTSESKEHKPQKKLSQAQQKDIKLLKQVENDELKHKKVSLELRKQIQQRRGELHWTQKQLAQKTNLPLSIINEIETGKALYNHQHINKIKRVLKI